MMAHPFDSEINPKNEKLKHQIIRHVSEPGHFNTEIDGLMLTRFDDIEKTENCFYCPTIGIVVQGFKHSLIGNEGYSYGEKSCLVAGIDIPSINHITDATVEKPFLAISLKLDRYLVSELVASMSDQQFNTAKSVKGVSVDYVDIDVLDAFMRLADLLSKPDQIPVMAPMIIREIHYRLLLSSQGACLHMICTKDTQSHHIANAITWLRENYNQPFNIDELAQRVHMATSTFHRHFKQVTTLSPLQFQKRLRLYEAQRLMMVSDTDASNAAIRVGYESVTQFNREYKRLFGQPPRRDVTRLQLSNVQVY